MTERIYKFILMAVTVMMVGCTKEQKVTSTKELNISFPPINLNLDPHKMEDAYSMTIVLQIFRGLLRYTPSTDLAPDIAEKWTESPDHKTFTFKLRDDARFSDGTPIDAINVQMSFARLFHLGAAMGADIDYISGASEFRKTGDISKLGIKIKSPKEVEFELSHPSALFLKHIAVVDCAILPIKNYKDALRFDSATPYSGPYKITSIDKNGATAEKWRKDDLDSKNSPQKLKFSLSEMAPIEQALTEKTDSLDHDPITKEEREKLAKLGWKETATELIAETYIVMNPKKVDKKLRQKLFSTIDQNELSKLLDPKFQPAFGAIPRGLPGELKEVDIKSLRVTDTNLKGKIKLEFDPKNEVHSKLHPFLKKKWEEAGISVELVPLSKRELLEKIFSSQCEVCIGQKGLDYPDGYSVLTYFKSGYPANYFYVHSSEIDSLVNESARILEKESRESHYQEIQKKILAEYTLIPLVFGSNASGMWSSKIEKIPPHVMGIHMLPFEIIEMRK